MRRNFAFVLGRSSASAPGCGGRTPPAAPPKPPDEPKLDVPTPWIDSAGFYPQGVAAPPTTLASAVEDPGATPIAIRDATILTATGARLERATIVLERGAITRLGGAEIAIPAGARVIDGAGKVVTPGIIDAHSHLGVYGAPDSRAHGDGNEATAPVTARPAPSTASGPGSAARRAVAGGVTTALILPGSANLIGGRGRDPQAATPTARPREACTSPARADGLKMACGENPKRVYGQSHRMPSTRMGEYARGAARRLPQGPEARARLGALALGRDPPRHGPTPRSAPPTRPSARSGRDSRPSAVRAGR